MAERDDESGRYRETFLDADFLAAIEDAGGAAGTQEVADVVGCEYRTANARLHELKENGDVEARKVANAYLWMLPTETDGGRVPIELEAREYVRELQDGK